MNTNINDIESRFTHDTVHYEDSELRALIEQLKSVHNLINSTIPSQVSALGQKGITLVWWKPRRNILAFKDFIQQYQADFADAVGKVTRSSRWFRNTLLSHKRRKENQGNR